MRRRLAVVGAQAARAVRGLWPDRNRLRRTLDRIEAAIVSGLAVAFLAGAPAAAVAAEHSAYSAAARTAYAQRSWHQTSAVLLASAPSSWHSKYGAPARVRWSAPDGTRRTGTVSVSWGAKAGSSAMVWVDASGRLTGPPLRLSQARGQAVLAAVLAPIVLGLLLLCAGGLAHLALDRRRIAAWDFDWQLTEPRWTRRQLSLPTAGTPGELAWRCGSPSRAWQPRSP
jgi:hypothetical protein